MKKFLTFAIAILSVFTLLTADQVIDLDQDKTDIQLNSNRSSGFSVSYQLGEIRSFDVNTKGGTFSKLVSFLHLNIFKKIKGD